MVKILINLSNRVFYTIATFAIVILSIFVINALPAGNIPNPGHSISEVGAPSGCVASQFLQWDGNGWQCAVVESSGGSESGEPEETTGGDYWQIFDLSRIYTKENILVGLGIVPDEAVFGSSLYGDAARLKIRGVPDGPLKWYQEDGYHVQGIKKYSNLMEFEDSWRMSLKFNYDYENSVTNYDLAFIDKKNNKENLVLKTDGLSVRGGAPIQISERISGVGLTTKLVKNRQYDSFPSSDWWCEPGSWNFYMGDINEKGLVPRIAEVATCMKDDGLWYLRFDFASHKWNEHFEGRVVCYNKYLVGPTPRGTILRC